MNTYTTMSTKQRDLLPPSRHHLWGPERRRLSSHLIQKALDALPGSRSSDSSPSKPYNAIKRPYEQNKFTGKASGSYVPEAPVSERVKRKERPLTPSEGYGLGVFGIGFEVEDVDGVGSKSERVERKFFGQGGSRLFGLLPREVRMEIYEWVLRERVLHIVRRKTKLGHVVCKCEGGNSDARDTREEDACMVAGCRGVKIIGGRGVHETVGMRSGGLIQLLQVCRRIYSEAISLLYSANTFDFDSMESLISFSNEILPRRFDSITSVTLSFSFDTSALFNESSSNNVPRWERTWMIIGSMKSLRNLQATIIWPRKIPAWSHEMRFLEPLKMVAGLDKEGFVVRLRELTREARGRGKARAYEVGRGFDVG
ncbi:fa631580-a2e0-4070-a688-9eee936aa09a-CDS [Sclerotinia trifoliorum]|uniref:Fa631580-a2e0-4070-a688-9eee936aa09a-CDS n=1 Tax=Sclerotinia trifoliorum TaxID=28548 RepID=A0A8H2VT20_9HELO|nr:fa631580-a2e0-4070-a688-9eee936aa09a-CDS [Sclerotinia trifoliorum]